MYYISLPYSIWSVWYQKSVAKQWCILCLITQLIVWSIFFINLVYGHINVPIFSLSGVCSVAIIYLLPFLLIITLTPKFIESNKVVDLTYEINSIKADEDVFLALLKKQKRYDVDFYDSKIVWGNRNANILITILTNPHCEPCGRMHQFIEKLLKKSRNKFCIQYILSYFNEYETLADSNRFLISAYLDSSEEVSEQIYSEWFKGGKYMKEEFYKKHNFSFDQKVEEEFIKHKTWIEKSKLMATPTILINGYILPEKYKIKDFYNLIDNILLDSIGSSKHNFFHRKTK